MWTFWTATPCTKYMKVPSIEAKRTKKLHKRSTGSFHSDSLHWWNSYEPFLFICRNELNSAKETKFNLTLLLQMNFEKYSINQCLLLVASVFFFFRFLGHPFHFACFHLMTYSFHSIKHDQVYTSIFLFSYSKGIWLQYASLFFLKWKERIRGTKEQYYWYSPPWLTSNSANILFYHITMSCFHSAQAQDLRSFQSSWQR